MRSAFWLAAVAMILPARALAADPACTAPDTPLRPVVATHTPAPYPEMSVMTKEQGTTIVEVSIGADGVPSDAVVVTSSGSVRLDEAAATHVKTNWRWVAPTRNCQPVAVKTRISVRWNLQDAGATASQQAPPTMVMEAKDFPPDALARHEQGTVVLTIYVLTDGTVALARVIQSSGFPDLDAKAQELVKTRNWTPARLDGKPVNTSLIVLSQWGDGH
jgi:TonB family protein